MTGRVVHFEVPFDDGDRARTFYQEAFGWKVEAFPGMDYTIVSSGPTSEQGPTESGYINGGMAQRDAEKSFTSPVIVIDVENIDDALTKIGELGGKTAVEKMPVGEMGFAAYFTDTEGNVVGLWETAKS
ncbi:VOC family protein [Actinokineospora xionganensis]|uniref:VOC family protein n=1 Tax=Actinokineospora xionganensis TaxID=2684470 RepID=A0ABR7LAU2_9PSEU|nr:VOC family protein [Actinokineospora xionganensis]MBC6449836.1 VOC family protein [Actinokineospora xionganensis]